MAICFTTFAIGLALLVTGIGEKVKFKIESIDKVMTFVGGLGGLIIILSLFGVGC